MFSKSANKGEGTPPRLYSGLFRSITGKLIAHFAFTAFVILALSTAVLYWGLVIGLEQEGDRYLQDEINVLKSLLRKGGTQGVEQKFEVGYAAREFMKTYARIMDGKGGTLLETHLMSSVIPPSAFPGPLDVAGPHGSPSRWRDRTGRTYLLRSLWVDAGEVGKQRLVLQIALDDTHINKVLGNYRHRIFVILILSLFVSAGAGVYIARVGMRPLREIAERTRTISASNLGERFQRLNWPEEISDLAVAFDAMLDRLQDSFSRLSQYSANLAHELRTPIGNLRGEAEVALTKARTLEEYRTTIESSLEEYERLSNTIDSLLFLARAADNQAPLNPVEIDIHAEFAELCDYYMALAHEKGIELTCEGTAKLTADTALFRRAVSNLLTNALKYTSEGGKVHVSTRLTSDSDVEILVSDTGCGIAEEHLRRVFDRFYRVNETRIMNPTGAGLGLSIVKSIMILHGGTVTIQSQPSKGTTVTLIFPKRSEISPLK